MRQTISCSDRAISRVTILNGLLVAIISCVSALTQRAEACSHGPLDRIVAGEGISAAFRKLGACGGEALISPYNGRHGSGAVLCADPSRDSNGKRVLIINDKVAAVRNGRGNKIFCSWGKKYGSD